MSPLTRAEKRPSCGLRFSSKRIFESTFMRATTEECTLGGSVRLVSSMPSTRNRTRVCPAIGSICMSDARCSEAWRMTVATIFVTGASSIADSEPVSVMSFSVTDKLRLESTGFSFVFSIISVSSSVSALPTSPERPLYCPSRRSKSVSVIRKILYGIPTLAEIKVSASRASRLSGSVMPISSTPSASPKGTSS